MRLSNPAVLAALLLAASCAGTTSSSSSDSGTSSQQDAGGGTPDAGPTCALEEVACADQVIQQLNLKTIINPDGITNTQGAAGWTSVINATAGGAFNPNPPSFIYARFTATGLEKMDLSDEQAMDSQAWHIAFRRYVIRINSGSSGPGCVTGVRMPANSTFEGTTTVPGSVTPRQDEFMSDTCELISDGSGLESSPATAMSSYYSYNGCVKTTGNIFVLDLAGGGRVKVVVDHYYSAAVQAECNSTGAATTMPTGSGTIGIRWDFLAP